MAFRELTMIDVKECSPLVGGAKRQEDRPRGRRRPQDGRALHGHGDSARARARRRGTDEEVHQVAQCVQARPLVAPSDEWNEVTQHRDRIERWLAGDDQTRPLRLIQDAHAARSRSRSAASYDTLWRYVHQHLSWRDKPSTVRVDDPPPGQEAQVDFGKMGWLVDAETGTSPDALGARRDARVQPLPVRLADVPTNHRGRLRGARPRLDVLRRHHRHADPRQHQGDDARSDALNATLVPAFLDYVQARGLFVDPARVRSPKDKPRVENQVPFVRESWFDGETFTGLDHARRERRALVSRDRRRTRARHHASRSPRDVRVDREARRCAVAPTEIFDVPVYIPKPRSIPIITSRSLQALYSVPHPYLASTSACASTASW